MTGACPRIERGKPLAKKVRTMSTVPQPQVALPQVQLVETDGEQGLWLGTWRGQYQGFDAVWLRFYDAEGRLVPAQAEVAAAAEQRAKTAEEEVTRLKERLAQLEGDKETT
jgi:hypothetical protein